MSRHDQRSHDEGADKGDEDSIRNIGLVSIHRFLLIRDLDENHLGRLLNFRVQFAARPAYRISGLDGMLD